MPSPRPSASSTHLRPSDARAIAQLAVQATLGVTGIVEHMHHNILRRSAPLGTASDQPTRGITGLVYRSIRGTTQLVGRGLEAALRPAEGLLTQPTDATTDDSDERAAVMAALNGVLGDHLEATANPLALTMSVQHAGRPLRLERHAIAAEVPGAGARVVLLVHGLCMNPRQWRSAAHDQGAQVAAACGGTLLHLHYNTGRHIAANGLSLADLLERLVAAWPAALEDLVIVGHSMGGLVARSACHQAARRGDRWLPRLRALACLGTPHHGSPLERGGRVVDILLGASPYSVAIGRIAGLRSAGITDLRHGACIDAPVTGLPAAVPLPQGVDCYAIAGDLGPGNRAAGRLLGDGLVPRDSALGRHTDPARTLAFAADRQWIAEGTGHIELLHSPAVTGQLVKWLRPA